MNEETHLKIVIAGLLTASIVHKKGWHINEAQEAAISSTEQIFYHFTKINKSQRK